MAGKFPLNGNRPVSTEDPTGSIPNSQEDVVVQINLQIEQDESVPVPLLFVAIDPNTDVLQVLATNYEGSDEGARSVATTLETAARAIREKLGELEATDDKPKRPRFNPQPVGGKR